jgi:hypothetical protein
MPAHALGFEKGSDAAGAAGTGARLGNFTKTQSRQLAAGGQRYLALLHGRLQNPLIHRPLLQQLLLKLGICDDAFLDKQLCQCVGHPEGGDHEFFE